MEKKNTFVDENGEIMNYPIGIQTFEKIRNNDFAYVDKTGRDLTVGVYNPFSIINAFDDNALNAYWFATGTPNFLAEVLKHTDFSLDRLTTEEQTTEALDAIDTMYDNPVPLFFQSGYLTIKGYDPELTTYRLGFPNTEVEQGFARFMATYYHGGNRKGTLTRNSPACEDTIP